MNRKGKKMEVTKTWNFYYFFSTHSYKTIISRKEECLSKDYYSSNLIILSQLFNQSIVMEIHERGISSIHGELIDWHTQNVR